MHEERREGEEIWAGIDPFIAHTQRALLSIARESVIDAST